MLIVIPCYKRSEILPLVIRSVIQSDVSTIPETIKILIVNNHYGDRNIIENIINSIKHDNKFECQVIHREVTIPGIYSWFSAIAENASENEVVFLLGDDDLMLPGGIAARYWSIIDNESDMLLSDFLDRIYFYDGGSKYWLNSNSLAKNVTVEDARPWNFFPEKHPEPSFMSNHCYRYTVGFNRGLQVAFSWCDQQNWLAPAVRTAMLPFYLPYAIKLSGGKVFSIAAKCVARGAVAQEAIKSSYADGGNVGFYNLCAFDVFRNLSSSLKDESLNKVADYFRPTIISRFFTMLFDRNIPFKVLTKTYSHSGLKWQQLITFKTFSGICAILVKSVGLRGVRIKLARQLGKLKLSEDLFREFYSD